jgi:peptidoglycan/LPS O-acetylase OafA/YrhL
MAEFKVNNFDLLRILAALQVVLIHTVAHLGIDRPALWGLVDAFPGVPIFFAISGFLISASFERTPSLAGYVRNRILRIVPALWCVVLLTVVVAAAFGFDFLHLRALAWLFAQLVGVVFTPSFLQAFGFGSYNGALWTIPIELQFYALLPLFYVGATRDPRLPTRLFAVAFVVFLVIAYAYALRSPPLAENLAEPFGHKVFRYSFIPHIYLFLTGALLQRWGAHRSPWIAGKGLLWLAGYLFVHFVMPWGTANYVLGTVLLAVMTVSLAYTAPGISHAVLRGNDISYGVYIYHGLVINILIELGHRGRASLLPLVVALTVVAAFLSWRLVERPFLRRKKQTIHAVPGPTG